MPGLLRGVARTAVVAGTASAVHGRVERRQAQRFATKDAQIYAAQQEAYAQQTGYAPQPPASAAVTPASQDEVIRQLRQLGELYSQGVLTEQEFAVQKAKLLNG